MSKRAKGHNRRLVTYRTYVRRYREKTVRTPHDSQKDDIESRGARDSRTWQTNRYEQELVLCTVVVIAEVNIIRLSTGVVAVMWYILQWSLVVFWDGINHRDRGDPARLRIIHTMHTIQTVPNIESQTELPPG